MISGPLAFYTILNSLMASVNQALTDKPERVCVYPGAIVWDECDCTMLAGTTTRWFYSDNFPAEATSETPCNAAFQVADLRVGIVRCVPMPPEGKLSVSCEALDRASQIMHTDAYILRETIAQRLCEMKENNDIVEYIVRDQTPANSGGCGGTELNFFVAVDR